MNTNVINVGLSVIMEIVFEQVLVGLYQS